MTKMLIVRTPILKRGDWGDYREFT